MGHWTNDYARRRQAAERQRRRRARIADNRRRMLRLKRVALLAALAVPVGVASIASWSAGPSTATAAASGPPINLGDLVSGVTGLRSAVDGQPAAITAAVRGQVAAEMDAATAAMTSAIDERLTVLERKIGRRMEASGQPVALIAPSASGPAAGGPTPVGPSPASGTEPGGAAGYTLSIAGGACLRTALAAYVERHGWVLAWDVPGVADICDLAPTEIRGDSVVDTIRRLRQSLRLAQGVAFEAWPDDPVPKLLVTGSGEDAGAKLFRPRKESPQ